MSECDDISSSQDSFSATSPLTISTKGSNVYKGTKGSLHRKHENPRPIKEKYWKENFIRLYCDGNQSTFDCLMERYLKLNEGDEYSTEQATGILSTFYEMGARETILRKVFGIGNSRYKRVVSGKPLLPRGGTNVNAVNDNMVEQLSMMVNQLPTEDGYPCGHRRMMKYCTDPDINTWLQLHKYYTAFVKEKEGRVMAFSTFHNIISS